MKFAKDIPCLCLVKSCHVKFILPRSALSGALVSVHVVYGSSALEVEGTQSSFKMPYLLLIVLFITRTSTFRKSAILWQYSFFSSH